MKQTIEPIEFTTTDSGLVALARGMLDAGARLLTGRANYMRSLLAIAQTELGGAPRLTQARKLGELTDAERESQLAALKTAHGRCWAVIEPVLAETLAGESRTELHRRATYVRTALATLRAIVHARISLLDISARTATKEALRALVTERRGEGGARPPLTLDRRIAAVVKEARALAAHDTLTAATVLGNVIDELSGLALELGLAKAVRTPAQAIKQHRPVQIGGGMFWPVATAQ